MRAFQENEPANRGGNIVEDFPSLRLDLLLKKIKSNQPTNKKPKLVQTNQQKTLMLYKVFEHVSVS